MTHAVVSGHTAITHVYKLSWKPPWANIRPGTATSTRCLLCYGVNSKRHLMGHSNYCWGIWAHLASIRVHPGLCLWGTQMSALVRVEVSRADAEVLMEGEQRLVLVASSSGEATCFCIATCQANAPATTSPRPRESRYSTLPNTTWQQFNRQRDDFHAFDICLGEH